ncbi:S1C family serine protease [Streptomyces incarnatus]|uniref:S1C family serine protease n=1 Tax=Streptomyces incarnatus TaxID=665007 RepID=UPI0024466E78|nr:trypsin-like peptidase domain-containing protein [Streptomyces incarnatus]
MAPGAAAPGPPAPPAEAPTPAPLTGPHTPAHGVPAPETHTPAAGVPLPAATAPLAVPGPPTPTAPAAAPSTPAAPGAPTSAAPAPGVSSAGVQPSGTPAPAVPASGVQPPGTPAPAPATPDTSAPGAPAPGAPAPAGAPAPGAPAPEGAPGPSPSEVEAGRRYDPWAVGSPKEQVLGAGALQQTGVGVLTHEERGRRGKRLFVGWSLLVALVSAVAGGVAGAWVERQGLGDDVRLPQAGHVPAGRAPGSVAGIAARALPSVVTLHVTGTDQSDTGTGFVLDTQGHILTNNHVVAPAGSGGAISVTFSSGDTVKAEVVGHDSGYDLAVVQVPGMQGLTPLPLGNSDDVRVGDPVVAIGAPFDLANTVTSGIISAKERPVTAGGEKGDGSDVSYVDALQTDAPINPGNSGGPLLDSRAQVIGINSAIRSADGGSDSDSSQAGSIGLGFAIPVNQAKRVAEELISDGHATHPVIGVTLDMAYTGDGARIDSRSANGGPAVSRGGPGDQAGLKAGDVITEVDGERVHTAEELIVKIRAHRPGDRLRLTVRRDGTDRDVPLRLGAAEQN